MGKEKYWIYPTFSAPYGEQVFLDAFSSSDLVNWEKHERIIDTSAVKWAMRAMWAPAVVKKDGSYFLFFAANDIQSNEEPGGIGTGISNKPQGPFRDYLGQPLLGEFHNGAQPIDQFIFKDLDGTYYMIYGGWRHCNIVRLKDDFTGFLPLEDGSLFKEITRRDMWRDPLCSTGMEAIISCGAKVAGPVRITAWPMPFQIHLSDLLNGSAPYLNKTLMWQLEPDTIL